jgi:hypothetical protein
MKRLHTLWLMLLVVAVTAPSQALGAEKANHATEIESQTNFGSLSDVPAAIFKYLIMFLPAVATIYLAIAGYRYITSQGNPDLIEKAKKSLTYAIVGVIVSYSAFVIIQFFGQQLGFGSSL